MGSSEIEETAGIFTPYRHFSTIALNEGTTMKPETPNHIVTALRQSFLLEQHSHHFEGGMLSEVALSPVDNSIKCEMWHNSVFQVRETGEQQLGGCADSRMAKPPVESGSPKDVSDYYIVRPSLQCSRPYHPRVYYEFSVSNRWIRY